MKGPRDCHGGASKQPTADLVDILCLTCCFSSVLMPFEIGSVFLHFFSCLLSLLTAEVLSHHISKTIDSSQAIPTVIVPGWINNPVVE